MIESTTSEYSEKILVKDMISENSATEEIVATLGNEQIKISELDEIIQLSLFDLEWRKYQLRKDMLKKMIDLRSQQTDKELNAVVSLKPPKPPRINLNNAHRVIKGEKDAPLTLSVFCSYQSSHCARLQPILKSLSASYHNNLNFIFYDFPQGFHRYAKSAANSVLCSYEFGGELGSDVWAYQDALYADISQLNKERYLTIAEQLNFNKAEFESCLDDERHMPQVKADVDLAINLGLGNVPVVFINGLYVKGPQTVAAYQYYIDQELNNLGLTLISNKPKRSTLELVLMATTLSSNQSKSSALIQFKKGEQAQVFSVGEYILDKVELVSIEEKGITLNNHGQIEFLPLQASVGHALNESFDVNSSQTLNEAESEVNMAESEDYKRRELPVTGEMTLSQDWLQMQLMNQGELEKRFYNAEHVVEGHHLIKLAGIDNDRFYTTLGIKSGDVLMRVNDQWVHEDQNPLWDSLAREQRVSIVLMRKGLPVRYDYKIN